MEIAKLREKILIQKNTVEIDRIGNHINTWTDYYTCFARPNTYTVDETTGNVIHENESISFSVRACCKTKCLTSVNYRVVFKDLVYDIVAIDMMNYEKKEIKIRCKKEVRNG